MGAKLSTVVFTMLFALILSPRTLRAEDVIDLGRWNQASIERLQNKAGLISDPEQRVAFISAAFLDTAYRANTLIGSDDLAEQFVIRLDGVDCFTLLDYVEALRRTSSFDQFTATLQDIRYRNGRINFLNRNHFFVEWGETEPVWLQNLTASLGGDAVVRVEKQLNRKPDGGFYLPGYPVRAWSIAFIPTEAIDAEILNRLRSGDYLGIYSDLPGLDVSHTGILIKKAGKVYLRHASSRTTVNRVVDDELISYLDGKKGLVIYRPVLGK